MHEACGGHPREGSMQYIQLCMFSCVEVILPIYFDCVHACAMNGMLFFSSAHENAENDTCFEPPPMIYISQATWLELSLALVT